MNVAVTAITNEARLRGDLRENTTSNETGTVSFTTVTWLAGRLVRRALLRPPGYGTRQERRGRRPWSYCNTKAMRGVAGASPYVVSLSQKSI